MVFFNYATMQMAAKIVYYGPGLCGKTTNLQQIYQKTSPKSRGEMVSLETETDRTLFFDLLPLDVGNIAGFKTRFQLYTVPGQVFYNSTRKLVLRGVDGVVFVADSQIPMMEANIESMHNLRENLEELGLKWEEVPVVIQYNKRDLKNIVSLDEMNRSLNPRNVPFFEASALQGVGVFETLKGVSKATLITLRKKALGEEKPKVPESATRTAPPPERPRTPGPGSAQAPASSPAPSQAPPPNSPAASAAAATSPSPAPPPANSATPAPQTPAQNAAPASSPAPPAPATAPPPPQPTVTPAGVSDSVAPGPPVASGSGPAVPSAAESAAPAAVLPTAAEIAKETVEFSEVATPAPKPEVKKIAVKSSDIATQLDALRDIYTAKPSGKKKDSGVDPLAALLGATSGSGDKKNRINKKLKIRLDPAELDAVKDLTVDFHLVGNNNLHKRFSNAMTVSVQGKQNPRKIVLEIELEILKK